MTALGYQDYDLQARRIARRAFDHQITLALTQPESRRIRGIHVSDASTVTAT